MLERIKKLWKNETEKPDPRPKEMPVGFKRPPTLQEQVQRLVRSEQLRMYAEQTDQETFEEAEDFNVGDDYDPQSPWEEQFEGQFEHEKELEVKRAAAIKKQKAKPRKEEEFEEEKPLPRKASKKPFKRSNKPQDELDELTLGEEED